MHLRYRFMQQITETLYIHTVCALLGPRQCGKTTLAKEYAKTYQGLVHLFDLERPDDLLSLQNPLSTLEKLTGLIIIDEIQLLPEIFPILRVLADSNHAKYLVLGSASRDLVQHSSETLAGRIGLIELTPLQLAEGVSSDTLLAQGGFPRSYFANTEKLSLIWRQNYVRTFLERDIPALGFNISALMLRRFWMMLTHVHGQIFNMAPIATALGVSAHTVKHYVDILVGTFMIRLMPPWYENMGKRQVKRPKIYFRDTGILFCLYNISNAEMLLTHPARGAIWEGFALEQIILALNLQAEEAFFWATHQGAELDLLVLKDNKRIGFEFKFADAPKTSKSMHQALYDLNLDKLYVVYPGKREFNLSGNIIAIGLDKCIESFTVEN